MSHHGAPPKPVPKFSFKPKIETKEEPKPPPIASTAPSRHDRIKERRAATPETAGSAPQSHQSQPVHRSRQHPDEAYTIDRRGDSLIRRYGSNNSREIPSYYRYGNGRVLGADGFLRFERTGSRNEFYFRRYHDKGPILSSDRKSFRAMSGLTGAHPIRVRQHNSSANVASAEYLPLRTSSNDNDAQGTMSRLEVADDKYRSVYEHIEAGNDGQSDDDDDCSMHSDSNTQQDEKDLITQRSIDLGRRVRDHPHDMNAWHELVDHQNILLQREVRDAQNPTMAELKSFSEVKLSLLEKAIPYAVSSDQREALQLRIMTEGTEIWDYKKTEAQWHEVLRAHPNSHRLWQAYLAFRQGDFMKFSYEDVKQEFIVRIKSISRAIADQRPGSVQDDLCRQYICTLLHATTFLSDAGYTELACSIWQAVLELIFCRPTFEASEAQSEIHPSFCDFWESEVSRFGEPNSEGWATFIQDPAAEAPEPQIAPSFSVPSTRDAYKAWAATETARSGTSAIPARTMDDSGEDDPFRVVMYNDIVDFLIWIPDTAVSAVKKVVIDGLLAFCHLPPAFRGEAIDVRDWAIPSRTSNGALLGNIEKSNSGVDGAQESASQFPDFEQHFQAVNRTSDVLFGAKTWFRYLTKSRDRKLAGRQDWGLGVLRQMVRQIGELQLAPYYFALHATYNVGEEKKTAKALLKQNPTNVDLYIGYSIAELARGEVVSARNIASAALGLPSISDDEKARLMNWLVWIRLESGQAREAIEDLQLLHASSDQNPASTTKLSDVRHLIASKRDYSISAGNPEHAVVYAQNLALLEYLTGSSNKEPASHQQGDIWSALKSVAAFSVEVEHRGLAASAQHEALLQFAARLLYFHATHGPMRLGFIREHLTKYIDYFPHNTIFHVLFAWRETRLNVDDRVRNKLRNIASDPAIDSVTIRAFIIQYEIRTGNANSTAAAFEAALSNSPQCKHHPQLWIAYIRFCHANQSLRSKAKPVFYRAIQRCPGSKDVFMEAFTTLVSDLDSSELKSVYNTMCEKGLRVHVELEEFVDEWKTKQREKRQRR